MANVIVIVTIMSTPTVLNYYLVCANISCMTFVNELVTLLIMRPQAALITSGVAQGTNAC